jgi:hypothetical protein
MRDSVRWRKQSRFVLMLAKEQGVRDTVMENSVPRVKQVRDGLKTNWENST